MTNAFNRNARLVALIAFPVALAAQPAGWRSQVDRSAGAAGALQFSEMIPGMHVTTPKTQGAVLYPAADSVAGRFMIDATIVLFPDSGPDGYGIMFGAQTLETPSASWSAFLVARDGRFRVIRRAAGGQTDLVAWTANDAILRPGAETVTNQLRVAVEPDSVRFLVNGRAVGALPYAAVRADGQFGLRLDQGMNVHVTNVDVARRLLKRRP